MSYQTDPEFHPSEQGGSSPNLLLVLCSLLVVSFIVWAMNSELDIVSITTGEVAPSSQLKTVQHLEGGIIREILVREGQQVSAGEKLIILEPTATGSDVGELQVRLTALKGDIARLDALLNGLEAPVFPKKLIIDYPEIVNQALQRFGTQSRRHKSELARQREVIGQRSQEIREIGPRIENGKRSLELVKEQVAISDKLMEGDLTNRFVHLDLLKELAELTGAVETDVQALASAEAALKEAKAYLVSIETTFEDEMSGALGESYRSYDELFQRIRKFEDTLERTIVRSPVDGVVKVIYVATVGGVLRPGDAVADIVPAGDRLVIDAQLPTHDIGYVRVGQDAVIKLASADAMRFGNLEGKVVRVSPDTLETPEGEPYYKVRIETDKAYFEGAGLRYDLYPGMQVMASIQTGKRTVMQYIVDPLRGNASSAMQER